MSREIVAAALGEAEELGRAVLLELLDDGLSSEEALALIAGLLDSAVPFRVLLPPPLGTFAEAVDGVAAAAAVRAFADLVKADPDRLERRADKAAARGHFLVAARRRARAAKIREN